MVKRTLEPIYKFVLSEHERILLNRIVVIGCGGNGSHLVSDVARLVSTLTEKPSIILIDGDSVEEKNLIRQHFIAADLGKNKAEVLASRYGGAYGVDIGYYSEYLTDENFSKLIGTNNYMTLFITCTDNLKSRLLVSQQSDSIWIDLGNEERGGQVSFSSLKRPSFYSIERIDSANRSFAVPTIFEIYPDMEQRAKEEIPIGQRSCAEIAEEAPEQVGFVNVMAAAIAKNFVHALLTRQPITTHQVHFTLDNAFEYRTMTKSVVQDWIETYDRFKNYSL